MTTHTFDEFEPSQSTVTVTESYGNPFTQSNGTNAAPAQPNRTATANVYDALRAELSKKPDLPEEKILPVPGRKNYAVKFSTDLDLEAFELWRKQSRKNSKKNADVDAVEFNSRLIIGQSICLVRNGKDVLDENGEPMGLRHPEICDMLGAIGGPLAAVKNLYGRDINILTTGAKVVEACGMADDEEELEENDPKD